MRTIAEIIGGKQRRAATEPIPVAAPATRSEALYRVQVGLSGIAAILLMLALADVITDRANRTEADSVPEAAATVAPNPAHSQQNDPLSETGVVPDLATPTPAPTPTATADEQIVVVPLDALEEE